MRVGVYIDAFNLYYGMRGYFGRSTSGWRWLDIRALCTAAIKNPQWKIDHIIYCTAKIPVSDQKGSLNQSICLDALEYSKSVDHNASGRYVTWTNDYYLSSKNIANNNADKKKYLIHHSTYSWSPEIPISIKHNCLCANVIKHEEKGSDVNVATHLLQDVFQKSIDAAIIISNDSDLELPIKKCKDIVPIGILNPSENYTAGSLQGKSTYGAGQHWWYKIPEDLFRSCQLSPNVVKFRRPNGW